MKSAPPRPPLDATLLWVTLGLMGLGLVMVYSASAVLANEVYRDHAFFFKRQSAWFIVGLAALWAGSRVRPEWLERVTVPLLMVTILALVAVWIPGLGRTAGGARRWMVVGGWVFQPGELARLAFVMYLAHRLHRAGLKMTDWSQGVMPVLTVAAVLMGLLILQPDFGTAAFLGIITLIMLYVGGARLSHVGALAGSGALLAILAVAQSGYRYRRWMAFLDPWGTEKTSGFQVVQSFLAFGSGGVFGTGLSESRQKFLYLPAPHTDFIFAIIGEELGWIGALAVLAAFAFMVWRGWMIARHALDARSQYLAFGLTLLMGIQVVMNMGVATGILPTKGTTLPLMSYGGSSLVAHCAVMGLLLGISRQVPSGVWRSARVSAPAWGGWGHVLRPSIARTVR